MLNFARLANTERVRNVLGVAAVTCALIVSLTGCAPEVEQADAAPVAVLDSDAIEQSRKDMSDIYQTDCYAQREGNELNRGDLSECTLAHPDAEFSVALVGDSHSAHWLPPIEQIAEQSGWKLTYFGKRGCSFGDYVVEDGKGGAYPECDAWNAKVMDNVLEEKYDVVLVSSFSRTTLFWDGQTMKGEANERARADGMQQAWQRVVDNGSDVVAIFDTPYLGFNVPDCLLENIADTSACNVSYEEAVTKQPHPDRLAAEQVPAVETIEMTDQFCEGEEICFAHFGEQIVYRDDHHMTASFALSMQDVLSERLQATSALSGHM